ncbi:ATP-dependent nuclease [Planctellipticum variicoloris]|uniref:ATP-dependent nuclease n=1 Tax=Planctellipticum variicoloris TaxID=3064265 RepID=UPI003013AD48|nr:ATP-binding protein [Planctomycetaceae bacterium SH412]
MKLENVAVSNYRTLQDVSVTFRGFYTAISGQNNAGKTTLIRAIRNTFKDNMREIVFFRRDSEVTYRDDKTQWVSGTPDISFDYVISVDRSDDPGLFLFLEKFNEQPLPGSTSHLRLLLSYQPSDDVACTAWIDGREQSSFASKEILQKLTSSNLAFMHDSADRGFTIYGSRGRHVQELMFSPDEMKQIANEQRRVQSKIKQISKGHRAELSALLGHLEDKYEVDFTIPDGAFSGTLPFSINLRDKNVDVPLNDWGSGTKNRTHIMMSILQANRIRSKDDENKITPIIIIEEPESFLHPSAQAEFGRVLMDLANELRIQTIVTTHSPYMLCQDSIASNVLLNRKLTRGRAKETEVVAVSEETWMEPFSEILGLDNAEFDPWRGVLHSSKQRVLLVEGDIDRKYLEHIHSLEFEGFVLPDGLDIVPYEGKDALKNTILLKFIIEKFKRVLVTFDLDAKPELERVMQQIGLEEGTHFVAVGVDRSGKQCIEGLIPERVLSKVHGQNTDLVMQLSAQESRDRKSAKSALKQKILAEFKSDRSIAIEDLRGFAPMFRVIGKALG